MPDHFKGNYFDTTFINKVKLTGEYVILLLFLHVDSLICIMLSPHQGKLFPSLLSFPFFSFFIYVYVCVYFILTGFIVVPTQTSHLSFTYTFYRVCFRISFKFKLIYCKVQAVNYFTVISEVAVLTLFQGNLKYLLQNICYKNK